MRKTHDVVEPNECFLLDSIILMYTEMILVQQTDLMCLTDGHHRFDTDRLTDSWWLLEYKRRL